MTSETRGELERLTSALCEEALDDAGLARLEGLLRDDAECRRFYLQYVDLHTRLLQHPGLAPPAEPSDACNAAAAAFALAFAARSPRTDWKPYLLTAVVTLAASLALQLLLRNPPPLEAPPPSAAVHPPVSYVATLTKAFHCTWDSDDRRVAMRLMPGELRLKSGRAVVHFDGGGELILEGPAVVNIDSATSATLREGKVLFRDDDSAEPFDLHTPHARLVDYGTEYAVSVGASGEEVHVFDGEVIRTPYAVSGEQLAAVNFAAGEARRFSSAADVEGQPVPLDVSGFRIAPPATTPEPADPLDGLMAYDSFEYGGMRVPSATADAGGSGWATPWSFSVLHDAQSEFRCATGLRRNAPTAETPGGALAVSRRTAILRRLNEPLCMDRDGIYYFSLMVRAELPKKGHPCDVHLVLRDRSAVDLKSRLSTTISWAHSTLSLGWAGGGVTASLPLEPSRTYLIVGKIAADDREPDQAFLRLFGQKETVPRDEPPSWTVAGRPVLSDRRFDAVYLSTNTATPVALDELRIGTSWHAVVMPYQTNADVAPATNSVSPSPP